MAIVMMVRASVRNGRLVMNEPTDLPEGTEVGLAMVEGADQLDKQNRARLHAALEASEVEFREGRAITAEEVMAELERGWA